MEEVKETEIIASKTVFRHWKCEHFTWNYWITIVMGSPVQKSQPCQCKQILCTCKILDIFLLGGIEAWLFKYMHVWYTGAEMHYVWTSQFNRIKWKLRGQLYVGTLASWPSTNTECIEFTVQGNLVWANLGMHTAVVSALWHTDPWVFKSMGWFSAVSFTSVGCLSAAALRDGAQTRGEFTATWGTVMHLDFPSTSTFITVTR